MRRRLAPLLVVLALLAVACSTAPTPSPTSTPPPGGLTSDQAAAAARQHVDPHDGELAVDSTTAGEFGSLGGGIVMKDVPADRWVWAVTFAGSFRASCSNASAGSSPAPGCSGATLGHETVVIDYLTGSLIVASLRP